jgi:hypothetical protein
MANQEKKGFFERGAGFFEKLHYGLGAAALAGALVVPEFAAPLAVFGAWEVVHGALWTVIKKGVAKKPKIAAVSG